MPTPRKQLIKSAQQKWGMIRKAYTVSLVQCVVLPDRIRIFTICLFLLFSFTCQVFHQLREVQKNIQLEKLKVAPNKKINVWYRPDVEPRPQLAVDMPQ